MRPYIYLVEVRWLRKDQRWVVEERSSRGTLVEIGRYRYGWLANFMAVRTGERLVREQGENLRLQAHIYDRGDKMIRCITYGRDPRSVA